MPQRPGRLPLLAVGVLLGAVSGVATAQDPPPGGASPVKILLSMKRTYASCRSYRDRGTVRTTSKTEDGSFGSEIPFETVFARPRLRFQFTDRGLGERTSVYIAWSDGTQVRSWWGAQPGVRSPASLLEALAPAAGISGGSSMRVPGLLLPREVGEATTLISPERIEDETDRGVACFLIRGKSRPTPYQLELGSRVITVQDEVVTLWIDRETFVLRKVEERRTYDSYRSEAVTTYQPEINVDIPAADLAFEAPQPQP